MNDKNDVLRKYMGPLSELRSHKKQTDCEKENIKLKEEIIELIDILEQARSALTSGMSVMGRSIFAEMQKNTAKNVIEKINLILK